MRKNLSKPIENEANRHTKIILFSNEYEQSLTCDKTIFIDSQFIFSMGYFFIVSKSLFLCFAFCNGYQKYRLKKLVFKKCVYT